MAYGSAVEAGVGAGGKPVSGGGSTEGAGVGVGAGEDGGGGTREADGVGAGNGGDTGAGENAGAGMDAGVTAGAGTEVDITGAGEASAAGSVLPHAHSSMITASKEISIFLMIRPSLPCIFAAGEV